MKIFRKGMWIVTLLTMFSVSVSVNAFGTKIGNHLGEEKYGKIYQNSTFHDEDMEYALSPKERHFRQSKCKFI